MSRIVLHVSLSSHVSEVAEAIEAATSVSATNWQIQVESGDGVRAIKASGAAGDGATTLAGLRVTSDDKLIAACAAVVEHAPLEVRLVYALPQYCLPHPICDTDRCF